MAKRMMKMGTTDYKRCHTEGRKNTEEIWKELWEDRDRRRGSVARQPT
jgi:hypothetical protein